MIYVLFECAPYEPDTILGIYKTRDEADRALLRYKKFYNRETGLDIEDSYYEMRIDEWEVGKDGWK